MTAPIAAWLYDDHGRELVWIVMPVAMLTMLLAGLALRMRTPESKLASAGDGLS